MIKISRDSSYCDRLRKYKVYIDDEYVGLINANETCEYNVKPGKHTVYAKIDWCRSNAISVEVGEEDTYIQVGASLVGWKILVIYLYITFLRNKYLWIKEIHPSNN